MIALIIKAWRRIRIGLAIHIVWLRPCLLSAAELEKLILLEFRSTALLFGFDISDMTDEEIKEAVLRTAQDFSKAGVSAAEAGAALASLAQAVNEINSPKSIINQNGKPPFMPSFIQEVEKEAYLMIQKHGKAEAKKVAVLYANECVKEIKELPYYNGEKIKRINDRKMYWLTVASAIENLA